MTPRLLLSDITFCVGFFTRLPAPFLSLADRRLSDAIWAAPVVGAVVAVTGAAVYAAGIWWGLSPGTAAALCLAAVMLGTGCLHEDGLSDVADGFGGGKTREAKLEIMRDSRIGAYGAAALGLSMLIRWNAIADLTTPAQVAAGLFAAHCASRALMPALMWLLPPARADGLAHGAGAVEPATALTALALGALSLLALGIWPAIVAAALLLVAFAGFRALCRRQIGGHTGDTLGAMQQIGEATVLLAASAYLI